MRIGFIVGTLGLGGEFEFESRDALLLGIVPLLSSLRRAIFECAQALLDIQFGSQFKGQLDDGSSGVQGDPFRCRVHQAA
jgi:hypothetical protein